MSATDFAQLAVAVAATVVFAVRVISSRRRAPAPASRWLTRLSLITALALLAGWPPLMDAVAGDQDGVLIALRVLQHCCVLGMALAFLGFAEHASRTSSERAHRVVRHALAIAVIAAAVMVAAAVAGAADLPEAPALHLFTPAYATSPAIAVYLVAYAVPLGAVSVEVGVRCGIEARRPGPALVRAAMALFLVGCLAGALYSALRIASTIATASGRSLDPARISFVITLAGIASVLAGSALFGAGRRHRPSPTAPPDLPTP